MIRNKYCMFQELTVTNFGHLILLRNFDPWPKKYQCHKYINIIKYIYKAPAQMISNFSQNFRYRNGFQHDWTTSNLGRFFGPKLHGRISIARILPPATFGSWTFGTFGRGDFLGEKATWRIIPFGRWLITMVVGPLPTGRTLCLINGGDPNHLLTGMILQVRHGKC